MKTKFKDTEIGLIPVDWEVEELQKIITKLGDGLHGTPKYEDEGNYYFINGNNLMEGKIQINETTKKCAKEEFEKYKKELNNRTIMISINGTLGNIALYNNEKVILGKSVCYFDVKEEFNLLYIKYVLKNNYFQNYIQFNATGTTIKNVSLKQMREFKFGIPKSLPEQTSIAKILSDLDSKIELLQKQNKTLEAIGQAIFKHWFVDFEFPDEKGKPYKSSGGEMVFKEELGKEIPKGWRVGSFGDIIEEKRIQIKERNAKVLSAVKSSELVNSEDFFDKQVYSKSIAKYLEVKKYEFAYNPSRINIGSIGMFKKDVLGAVSPIYVVFKCRDGFHYFIENQLKTTFIRSQIKRFCSGTVRQSLKFEGFGRIKLVIPSKSLVDVFNVFFENLIKQKNEIQEKIITLQKIRDLLLPKLMSGKIRVPVEVE